MTNESLNLTSAPDATIDGPAAEQLLSYLGDEATSLAAMLNAVREVHQALMVLDDNALKASLVVEARELSSNVEIQSRRRQFQNELATVLQVAPGEVTLRRLAMATSGTLRESIERIRRSLSEMATELDRLNRQNAAMIGQSLAIARGVVERLTGTSASQESYDAVGGRAKTHVGPLIQWGG